jgi:hypothetical protein
METSGRALVDHWKRAADKGVMNRNTAAGMRAACAQVLSILEKWESVNVRGIDVEDLLVRFQTLKKKDFKPAVLETYKRRFRQAHASYLAYLDDPGSWKPRTLERTGDKTDSDRQLAATHSLRHEIPLAGLVEYPFPLRDGLTARLVLPRDMNMSEVKRLSAFMATLTIDFDPSRDET